MHEIFEMVYWKYLKQKLFNYRLILSFINQINSCTRVIKNILFSSFMKIFPETHQEFPLSSLFSKLALDLLACFIVQSKDISGITTTQRKVLWMTCVLLVLHLSSIQKFIDTMKQFRNLSYINWSKSQLFPVGSHISIEMCNK